MNLSKVDYSLDPRDIYLENEYIKSYPQEFSLVDYDNAVENQYDINSCVANATCSALELMTLIYDKDNGTNYFKDLSRLYVYYFLRKAENFGLKNVGTYLKDGFKVVNKFGVCTEKDFPYTKENIYKDIPIELIEKAKIRKCNKYREIPGIFPNTYNTFTSIKAIKSMIAQKIPVIFAMQLYEDFNFLRGNSLEETVYKCNYQKYIGNHAMVIVGYNKQGFIVENSWGQYWGYKGRFILPYEVFVRNVFDAWVCIDYQDNDLHIKLEPKKNIVKIITKKDKTEPNIFQKIILFFKKLFHF